MFACCCVVTLVRRHMTIAALTILYGTVVGFSLGLTGGGGSVFAVPLLVYGVGLGPHHAVCISMVAVAITAALGAAQKMRTQVDVFTALLVAAGGLAGAPVGTWLGRFFSGPSLLLLFGSVVMLVGLRMLFRAPVEREMSAPIHPPLTQIERLAGKRARAAGLVSAGIVSGVLSGLLGIGGGFVIVPTLLLFAGMKIQRAIATSLLVIALIGVSAVASHLIAGQTVPAGTTTLFALGSIAGFSAGSAISNMLSPARLEKIFAVVMLLMGAFLILRNFR